MRERVDPHLYSTVLRSMGLLLNILRAGLIFLRAVFDKFTLLNSKFTMVREGPSQGGFNMLCAAVNISISAR